MEPKILTLPGLGNSGPGHWMSLWEREHKDYRRVLQKEWDKPTCEDWVEALEEAVGEVEQSVILVAHSLGCVLVAHWAQETKLTIRGALLVAPADIEAPSMPAGTEGFSPMPLIKLPFPSVVVASRNDPYCGQSSRCGPSGISQPDAYARNLFRLVDYLPLGELLKQDPKSSRQGH